MTRTLAMFALVTLGAPLAFADQPAKPPAPAQPTAVTAHATAPASPARKGLALGVELGDPTSATAAWFQDKLAVSGALGTGTFAGPGFSAHVDAQLEVHRLAPEIPLRVGLGARYYNQHYQLMSASEIPDSHYGFRASVAIAYERGPLELYAELAPGVDVKRTQSCTLRDGPYSICPHAQSSPLFVQFAIGVRWFLSH
jgi:hypothetical protein